MREKYVKCKNYLEVDKINIEEIHLRDIGPLHHVQPMIGKGGSSLARVTNSSPIITSFRQGDSVSSRKEGEHTLGET